MEGFEWALRVAKKGKDDHLKSPAVNSFHGITSSFPKSTPGRERHIPEQAPKRPGDLWPSQQNPDSQTLPLAGAPRVPAFSSAYLTQGKAFGRENALFK